MKLTIYFQKLEKRSQDLEKVFSISGAVWIIKSDKLKKFKTFYCPGHKFFPIDTLSALDIDTKDDLVFARKNQYKVKMTQLKFIKSLFNISPKFFLVLVFFLLISNIFEAIGILSLLPLIELTISNDNSWLKEIPGFYNQYLLNIMIK